MKKFTKKVLTNALGFNADEVKLIMKAQNMFPELLTEENEDSFVIDGEILCGQLGVKSNYNDWLLRSAKGKEGKLIKYRMVENVDFISISEKSDKPSGGRPKNKIMLTLNCAKKIAMRQNNEQGDLVCDYFILMEKAVKKMYEWDRIRHPEKKATNIMNDTLKEKYKETHENKEPNSFVYSNEADMLNRALFGKTSKQMKEYLGILSDEVLRDNLGLDSNDILASLITTNTMLILNNMDFETRKNFISSTCETRYKYLQNRVEEVKRGLIVA